MQTVLTFMAVETKANILWYFGIESYNHGTLGDKHFLFQLFPSAHQSSYRQCLTNFFNFFLARPTSFKNTSLFNITIGFLAWKWKKYLIVNSDCSWRKKPKITRCGRCLTSRESEVIITGKGKIKVKFGRS